MLTHRSYTCGITVFCKLTVGCIVVRTAIFYQLIPKPITIINHCINVQIPFVLFTILSNLQKPSYVITVLYINSDNLVQNVKTKSIEIDFKFEYTLCSEKSSCPLIWSQCIVHYISVSNSISNSKALQHLPENYKIAGIVWKIGFMSE